MRGVCDENYTRRRIKEIEQGRDIRLYPKLKILREFNVSYFSMDLNQVLDLNPHLTHEDL